MEPNILEQTINNLITTLPTISVGIENKNYVLIAINNGNISPLKFSNSIDDLHQDLENILTQSLFIFKKIGKYKYIIPELDLIYDIIETNSIF